MKVRLAAPFTEDSIVDGEGIRSVIWFQGCSHHCKECQNPETWPFDKGMEYDVEDVKKMIDNLEDQDGITFSGGDPMFQPEALLELIKHTHEKGMNVWVYTGFTYEEILKLKPIYKEILENTDVLFDGRFEIEKKTMSAKFRGSSNQRVINVSESIKQGKVIIRYE